MSDSGRSPVLQMTHDRQLGCFLANNVERMPSATLRDYCGSAHPQIRLGRDAPSAFTIVTEQNISNYVSCKLKCLEQQYVNRANIVSVALSVNKAEGTNANEIAALQQRLCGSA